MVDLTLEKLAEAVSVRHSYLCRPSIDNNLLRRETMDLIYEQLRTRGLDKKYMQVLDEKYEASKQAKNRRSNSRPPLSNAPKSQPSWLQRVKPLPDMVLSEPKPPPKRRRRGKSPALDVEGLQGVIRDSSSTYGQAVSALMQLKKKTPEEIAEKIKSPSMDAAYVQGIVEGNTVPVENEHDALMDKLDKKGDYETVMNTKFYFRHTLLANSRNDGWTLQ